MLADVVVAGEYIGDGARHDHRTHLRIPVQRVEVIRQLDEHVGGQEVRGRVVQRQGGYGTGPMQGEVVHRSLSVGGTGIQGYQRPKPFL